MNPQDHLLVGKQCSNICIYIYIHFEDRKEFKKLNGFFFKFFLFLIKKKEVAKGARVGPNMTLG